MARPKKSEFPINLETVLRVALPRKRLEDRMKIFREWARVNLWVKLGRQPTDEEFHTDLEQWCQKQFNNIMQIDILAMHLMEFVPRFSAENRKKRAQIAAQKRWSKKNKKPLDRIFAGRF